MLGKFVNIEVDGEELKQIFKDLEEAENTILKCYGRLKELGVLQIKDSRTDKN